VILCAGDITRREAVLWGVTLAETEPWLEYQKRQLRFRETVIAALGGAEKPKPEDEYCAMCRQLGEDDCANCSKEIKSINLKGAD